MLNCLHQPPVHNKQHTQRFTIFLLSDSRIASEWILSLVHTKQYEALSLPRNALAMRPTRAMPWSRYVARSKFVFSHGRSCIYWHRCTSNMCVGLDYQRFHIHRSIWLPTLQARLSFLTCFGSIYWCQVTISLACAAFFDRVGKSGSVYPVCSKF